MLLLVGGAYFFRARAAGAPPSKHGQVLAAPSEPHSKPELIGRRAAPEPAALRPRLHGRVQARGAKPIAGARLCILDSSRDPALDCTESDAAGRFELESREGSAATLYVTASEYQSQRRSVASLSHEDALILTLLEGGAAITGSVRDALGGTIAGAVVRAASGAEDDVVAVALSSSDGTFRLELPPGRVLVSVEADGYSSEPISVSAPARGLFIVLAPASSLVGRVLVAGSRAPAAGVTVSATTTSWPSHSVRSVVSAVDGSFRLTGLSAGVYSLLAASDQFRGEVHDIALGQAEISGEVEILVDDAVGLQGLVRADGERCPHAWVTLSGPVEPRLTSDDNGAVSVEGLRPGRYSVEVQCNGTLPLRESIDVGRESLKRVWDLKRGLQLRGIAKGASGVTLAGARIEVNPVREEGRNVGCQTDEGGRFSCSGLEAGDYECIIAGLTEPLSEPVHVSLPADSSRWIELNAKASGSIRVHLDDSARFELAALPLFVHREGLPKTIFGHWEADELVFEPLALGSYEIRSDAAKPGSGTRVELNRDAQVQVVRLNLAAHRLSGRVVDAAGVPVPDAWVRAQDVSPDGPISQSSPVISDEWGAFSIAGLSPGPYRVSANSRERVASVEADSSSSDVLVRLPAEGDRVSSASSAEP